MDILAYPAWCQFWCHSVSLFGPPRSLHCGLCSLASPSLACLPVLLLLLLSGEVAELPGLPTPASESCETSVGNREPQKDGKWVGRGPALSADLRSGVRLGH